MGKRPVGVTLIAGGLVLLGVVGLFIAADGLLYPPPPPDPNCTGMLCNFDWRPIVLFLARVEAVLSAWVLVTGGGLLGRFEWARQSAMVLAGVPFLLGLFLPGHSFGLVLGLGLIGVGGPLIWYFSRPQVKSWFAGARTGQAAG